MLSELSNPAPAVSDGQQLQTWLSSHPQVTVRPWPKTLHEPAPDGNIAPQCTCFYYLGLKKKQVGPLLADSAVNCQRRSRIM